MKRKRVQHRRGTILICVMACLAIVVGLVGVSLQFALRSHAEARVYRQRLQVEFLCEAGSIRAQDQLRRNPEYKGEIWLPPNFEGQLDVPLVPTIEIVVGQGGDPNKKSILVNAALSDETHPLEALRQSHTFEIKNSLSKNQEPQS